MPALGMAQETGKLLSWLKDEGDQVSKGEPLLEVETDKAAVEIEAPASGVLRGVLAAAGQDIPVGETIAWILGQGELLPDERRQPASFQASAASQTPAGVRETQATPGVPASPLARRMAASHQLDLGMVKPDGGRVTKADVTSYLARQQVGAAARLLPASPKARRLAGESGLDLEEITGSGPEGAVLAADVRRALAAQPIPAPQGASAAQAQDPGTLWRSMAAHVTASWQNVPHFYLLREVNASRLQAWRQLLKSQGETPVTVTDLLVRLAASALRKHPAVNSRWEDGRLLRLSEVNIGLAVAVDDGLVVPVIQRADQLTLAQISERRRELIQRAQAHKLRPADLEGGTFTISNLGMYGVDIFNAILNQPQAAILAVGRIAERVVAVQGQPSVQPTLYLSISFDHRAVDGARGARFLDALADLIEEPLGLID